MHQANSFLRIAVVTLAILAVGSTASAQNLLTNPGFEDGSAPAAGAGPGWITFGNVFTEASFPLSGSQTCKMFGNFSGGFDVTGIFQEFACSAGEEFQLSSNAYHSSDDPMIGVGPTDDNWVVQKIAFFDGSGNELTAAASESIILDGTFAVDTWHAAAPITATAPAGAATVQALILYLQPASDGGAAFIDDVVFENITPVSNDEGSFGKVKSLYQ
ncbi:MAG TPA: hypothetical protein VKA86_03055 [Candidatus Krumholzibacteria bacterium]|nr:hypothetical protein [Candidatus Krumholzibacteria bacterium]